MRFFIYDILDLGNDTIDKTLEEWRRFEESLAELDSKIPIYHVIGNHDLVLPRDVITAKLGFEPGRSAYKCIQLPASPEGAPAIRLVFLDSMDVSLKGSSPAAIAEAKAWLAAHPSLDVTPRAQTWNGALGPEQLQWLNRQLEHATLLGELVLVFVTPITRITFNPIRSLRISL
jgi:hypothetical protein